MPPPTTTKSYRSAKTTTALELRILEHFADRHGFDERRAALGELQCELGLSDFVEHPLPWAEPQRLRFVFGKFGVIADEIVRHQLGGSGARIFVPGAHHPADAFGPHCTRCA